MKEKYIITIGRQLGSGGREIGYKLANLLGISFYDKELIRIASRESGVGEEFFEKADEKKRFTFFGNILGPKGSLTDDMYTGWYLNNETLFRIQSDIIRSLADKASALFVGRCADYILKDHPGCLNVFIYADSDDRIKRVSEHRDLPKNKAKTLIEKTDKIRADYYNYFTGKEWGSPLTYHLCINSSLLGVDGTVDLIKYIAEKKFGIVADS
ncbi:MAG TPA: cytidylate kinase-like family protein [Bacteroidales bacterium]|nr:cytidylate kinase-like family protein [Bacteroidales bacterium]HPF01946.1 cytidylate kinase-like family protein [Bacteroidales bacterium]HPJ59924.1 cytidylate kinase-like family protein [Bacteroidales bacterium]HPR12312.1 cytidylate kinase-like family protein [Bacteroidales bacterium]HRW83836.1 cytidylate kinase-like family protein [Bacteroidales bacterium]